MTTGKKWMLVYSIIFLLLSILFVANDISNEYNLVYIIWMSINYILINTGNILFTIDRKIKGVQKVWKVLFPIFLVNLIISLIIDQKYGANSSPDDSLILNISTLIIVIALFFPAFRANFKWAYK